MGDWKLKNNKAKIAKLEKDIDFNKKEEEDTLNSIKETEEYMTKITKDREAEHIAFENAKSEDEAAVELLNTAKDALTKFYKERKIDMGKIQGSVKGAFAQEEPVFDVS